MILHLHVSVDNSPICLGIQPQVVPVDEITPTGSCVDAEQGSTTEDFVSYIPMFQNPVQPFDIRDSQWFSLFNLAWQIVHHCPQAPLANRQVVQFRQMKGVPAKGYCLKE